MILIYSITAITLLAPGRLAFPGQGPDPAPAVRRIASTVLLAAEEYRLGFEGGRVVATAEVEEARLFLTEAARSVADLPPDARAEVRRGLDQALAMVQVAAPPDSVLAKIQELVAGLAARFGVSLDEVPAEAPSLARGAAIYQSSCARCHGVLGRGDGRDGEGLRPPPSDLTDPRLAGASPLDFYRRATIGVAGTAMPGFESTLPPEDRWAVALYASTLRLPAPAGAPIPPPRPLPPALTAFATTARMSDSALLAALGPGAGMAGVATVRASHPASLEPGNAGARTPVFDAVRRQLDSAVDLAAAGRREDARRLAFDAYFTFERVEREVRVKDPGLTDRLEGGFAAFRDQAASQAPGQGLRAARRDLGALLERAERAVGDRLSSLNLFLQSFILLLREGLEAILVIGALIAFLVKTGASARRRDIHIGVAAAIGASLLTAVALETVFLLTPARRELLEGITLAAAAGMLFYVSYWLLSKIEVARWNRFVRDKVRDALTSGSALALAAAAFLAVYREGFETVLFYKALLLSAGAPGMIPVVGGMAAGGLVLALVYAGINRFGVRLPLKPFFGVTSAFLYYMAFVFAGKAVAELQESGVVGTTVVEWGPRVPMMGIYPTLESLAAQGLLAGLALVALAWLFGLAPRRARGAARAAPEPGAAPRAGVPEATGRDLIRSLDRIEADVAEIRAELDRLRSRLAAEPRTPVR